MRQAGTHALPVAVEAMAEARNPAEAAFDEDEFQLREMLEHAFHDQAGHLRLAGGGVLGHLLDVERRPAGIADGAAAIAEDVHADRQARLAGRFVDRPVAAAAHQFAVRVSISTWAKRRSPARRRISAREASGSS